MSYEHAKTQRRGESYVNSHANKMMTSQANIHAAFFFKYETNSWSWYRFLWRLGRHPLHRFIVFLLVFCHKHF